MNKNKYLCKYGCGKKAKYQLKNGKWCCSKHYIQCPNQRKKNSIRMKKIHKDPNSKYNSIEYKEKVSNNMKDLWKDLNGVFYSESYKEKQSKRMKEEWDDPNSKFNSILWRENQSNILKKAYKNPDSKYNSSSCREKKRNSMKDVWKDPNSGLNTSLRKEKQSNTMKKLRKDPNSKYNSSSCRKKMSITKKFTLGDYKIKHPFFSKIEEMRYNPNNPEEKEIQVHCKNHNCKNSKEKSGWFTPTSSQLYERIRQLEKEHGNDGGYFYCCQCCKNTCILFGLQNDPFKENNLPYTAAEYQTCRAMVFEREKGLCEYCGEPATHMHHIKPQKLEPFFALDPDYCVVCCEKCHYEKGHNEECSTGNLSKVVCSVESQKFLNQKYKEKTNYE